MITISWIWLPLLIVLFGIILTSLLSIISEDFMYIIGIPTGFLAVVAFWFYVIVGIYYSVVWLINHVQII